MASYEEELKKLEKVAQGLSGLALMTKTIELRGKENFVKQGPNILIGNHCGTFKDVAVLFKIVPRPFYFTANKMIFSRDEFNTLVRRHLQRHMKNFGLFLNLLLGPLKALFVQYISANIAKIGTIPVDLSRKKREAIELCQEYLRKGRAIITLQGRGRVDDNDPHPYIEEFRRGPSIMAYNLHQENVAVPVTPVAIFGSQLPFVIPGKIMVNIGQPMYIKDYLTSEAAETIERFRLSLEARVKSLFLDLIRVC